MFLRVSFLTISKKTAYKNRNPGVMKSTNPNFIKVVNKIKSNAIPITYFKNATLVLPFHNKR